MIKDKESTLKITTDEIEKKFGKGAIMRLGESTALNVEAIPTGALPLDVALGIGGVPRGRIVEIYGPESSGKTTVALHIIAEAQAAGGIVAFIDAEHALDPVYAARLGVDVDELLISQPDTGEQALEILRPARSQRHDRLRGHRLGRSFGATRRDRRRNGRCYGRPASPPHEPSIAQAHGFSF